MEQAFEYYYNNVPGEGLCRNNLIYTSLISTDKKTFVQWYHNDSEYHRGKNEVVDPELMKDKWYRELKYITLMNDFYPQHIPKIIDIHLSEQKLFLEIEGVDFWEKAGCLTENFDSVLPDWQEQMLEILKAHLDLGIYKYSLHPSSYFIVDGKLKSINYFFAYHEDEEPITVEEHLSHISFKRRQQLFSQMSAMGIDKDKKYSFKEYQILCLESFSNNYPKEFIDRAKSLYV